MDIFEHALIIKSGMGILVRGGIPQFTGQPERAAPTDVLDHLQLVGEQGWELVTVEPQAKLTAYWLRRRRPG